MATKPRQADVIRVEPICVGADQASVLLDIGRSTFLAHVSRGTLPKPRMLGGRALWLVDELRAAAYAFPMSDLLPPVGTRINDHRQPGADACKSPATGDSLHAVSAAAEPTN